MFNITKYRKAKIYVKDFEKILFILNKAIKELEPYRKYIPVLDALEIMDSSVFLLEMHYKHQKKILETKGQEDG